MNMNMKEIFQVFGLREKEAEVFLLTVEIGPQPASVISKHCNIARSSIYFLLEKMVRLGMLEKFEHRRTTFFRAISIDQVQILFSNKLQEIANAREALLHRLPELKAMENKTTLIPKVRIFEGSRDIEKIYETVLREKSFCTFFNPQMQQEGKYFDKIPQAIRRSGMHVKEILVSGPIAEKYREKYSSAFHQIKLLPKEVEFLSDTIICDERLFTIGYGKGNVFAVEIVNAALVKTRKSIFDFVWSKI